MFVREGAQVLAADISGREDETAGELATRSGFRVDVTQEEQVEAMFAAALEAFGRVDAVLNVAGIGGAGPVQRSPWPSTTASWTSTYVACCSGPSTESRQCCPTGGGSIINWSSIGGLNASDMPTSVYSAAKAGVIAFTKAAAVEYGAKGIRANAICPGLIVTELSGGQSAIEQLPATGGGRGHEARRPARGGRRAGVVPGVGPGELHHRRGDPVDGGNTCALR